MKKRYLFLITLIAIMCLFAISVSAAEIPEWTELTDVNIAAKEGFDTTSRVLLSNGDGTYSTYLANYIIDGTDKTFSEKTELNFEALKKATGKEYTYASVVRLEVPSGYTVIGGNTFRKDRGFSNLLTVKIPEGVTKLGTFCFYQNNVTVEVELPQSLETIEGTQNFYTATALEKINIPSKITTIAENCFKDCKALTTVTGCEGLIEIHTSAFRYCPLTNTDSDILLNVEVVGNTAFYGSGIEVVNLPKATSIGSKAFAKCLNLTTVVIGPAVIGNNAFDEKCPITSLTLINTVSIGTEAFQYIEVEHLVIPTTCLSIGSNAFKYGNYTTITISSETAVSASAFASQKNNVTLNYVGDAAVDASAFGLNASKTTVSVTKYCDAYNGGTHTFSGENTVNDDNYFATITVTNDCTKCGEQGAVIEEISPLFAWKGYSYSTFGDMYSVMQGFFVNSDAVKRYITYVPDFEYGLIAAANLTESGKDAFAPSLDSDFCVKQSMIAHDYFDVKVTEIAAEYADTYIVFCAFVRANGNVYYLDGGNTSSTVTGISYSGVATNY